MRLALYGPQGVGKTTIANALEKEHGLKRLSFADPIYDILTILEGKDTRSMDKNEMLTCLPMTLRDGLKSIGQGLRAKNPNIWVENLARRCPDNAVIDDMRMANEYEWCEANGFYTVELTGDVSDSDTHSTEQDRQNFIANISHHNDLTNTPSEIAKVLYECGEIVEGCS